MEQVLIVKVDIARPIRTALLPSVYYQWYKCWCVSAFFYHPW